MPYLSEKIRIQGTKFDRRVKLTPQQKAEIRHRWTAHVLRARYGLIGEHLSQRKLAKEYKISRRLIQFIIDPNKHEANLKARIERGGSKQYYKKDQHTKAVANWRRYKQKLKTEGLIK